MAVLKKILIGALILVLIMTFAVCVYAYGEDKVFSLEVWLTNVAKFSEAATFRDVADCWTKDSYKGKVTVFVEREGVTAEGDVFIYLEEQEVEGDIFYEDYDGDNVILKGLDNVRGFFRRLGRSFKMLFTSLGDCFANVDNLLPWNATVPRGEL